MKRTFLDYTLDFLYATFRYHNGFTKPRVWFGYFEGETAQIQQTFFIKLMMDDGLKERLFN